jgi:hypothetical protein
VEHPHSVDSRHGRECLLEDESGRPLPGWTVDSIWDEGGRLGVDRQVADALGRFVAVYDPAMRCMVATPPGGDATRRRALTPARVTPRAPDIRVRVRPGSAIVVFLDDGSPPACVHDRVEFTTSAGGTARSVAPDADGLFVLDGLAPTDVVDLSVRRPGHDTVTETGKTPGTIVRMRLRPRVRPVSGTVVDADGRPVKLGWVRFVPVEWGLEVQTLTAFDGAFEEPRALDMDYDVRVMFRDPKTCSEPGESMGVFHGGARGLVLRLSRGN